MLYAARIVLRVIPDQFHLAGNVRPVRWRIRAPEASCRRWTLPTDIRNCANPSQYKRRMIRRRPPTGEFIQTASFREVADAHGQPYTPRREEKAPWNKQRVWPRHYERKVNLTLLLDAAAQQLPLTTVSWSTAQYPAADVLADLFGGGWNMDEPAGAIEAAER